MARTFYNFYERLKNKTKNKKQLVKKTKNTPSTNPRLKILSVHFNIEGIFAEDSLYDRNLFAEDS